MGVTPFAVTALAASAGVGYLGAQNAARTQADAANQATAAQLAMFNEQQANQKPYREAGYGALDQINKGIDPKNPNGFNKPFTIDDFKANQDPSYQFLLDQGQKALKIGSTAGHGMFSAGTQAALSNYSQNMASNEYSKAFDRYQTQINNSYNRLASVAGLGQAGVQGTNAAAQNAGNNISSNIIGAGNANAAGIVGGANAFNNTIGQGIGLYNTQQLLNKIPGQDTTTPMTDSFMPSGGAPVPTYSTGTGSQFFGGQDSLGSNALLGLPN